MAFCGALTAFRRAPNGGAAFAALVIASLEVLALIAGVIGRAFFSV